MDWENRYRQGDTPWDRGAPSPGLVEFLERTPLHGRILVPGCGPGHDAVAIACASPEADVVGYDISPTATAQAARRYGSSRVSFAAVDFLEGRPSSVPPFDATWEHTLFCAIDPSQRGRYAQAAASYLRPGGIFLAIWYMTPDISDRDPPPFPTSEAELDQLFSSAFERVRSWRPETHYEGREGREEIWLMLRR